jgi:hypothetical protein
VGVAVRRRRAIKWHRIHLTVGFCAQNYVITNKDIMAYVTTLQEQMLKLPAGGVHDRFIIIGEPDYQRRLNDRMLAMGKLKYYGRTPTFTVTFSHTADILQELAREHGDVAYHALTLEVPRYGFHLFNRLNYFRVLVTGNQAVVDATLKHVAELFLFMQAENCLKWIVDDAGKSYGEFPQELSVLQSRGPFKVRSSVKVDSVFTALRKSVQHPIQSSPVLDIGGSAALVFVVASDDENDVGSGASRTPSINPTTGLPMVDGPGGLVVGGHTWGTSPFQDINPGSGLPTIAGPGSQDIAGNSWGSDHL